MGQSYFNLISNCTAHWIFSSQSEALLSKTHIWPNPQSENTWQALDKVSTSTTVPTGAMLGNPWFQQPSSQVAVNTCILHVHVYICLEKGVTSSHFTTEAGGQDLDKCGVYIAHATWQVLVWYNMRITQCISILKNQVCTDSTHVHYNMWTGLLNFKDCGDLESGLQRRILLYLMVSSSAT